MTVYPANLDNIAPVIPGQTITSNGENLVSSAINAIEVALGTNPFGPYATVALALAGKLDVDYGVDSTNNTHYSITLTPAPSAYTAGMFLRFKAVNANVGPATLNVNSLGTVNIVKNGTASLVKGDIAAGQIVTVTYDGINFQLVGTALTNTPNFLYLVQNFL